MPKIVILGSCRFEPYEILAIPNKLDPKLYQEDHEKAYLEACKKFYPAIEKADVIIVFAPDGIGEHTARDIEYAKNNGKKVYILKELKYEDCLLEELAELEHQQWMEWATTILKTESISQKRKDRWFTMFCPYSDLPEENKEFDREWARKALAIIQASKLNSP